MEWRVNQDKTNLEKNLKEEARRFVSLRRSHQLRQSTSFGAEDLFCSQVRAAGLLPRLRPGRRKHIFRGHRCLHVSCRRSQISSTCTTRVTTSDQSDLCPRRESNPRLKVQRAHFSALIPRDIHR
eukprot:3934577-Rhodomonas_salina.1